MSRRRIGAVSFAVLAAGALAALTGCEWFQGSDPGQRSSPAINSLSIQPSSVLCDQEFAVSFKFEDPQGDIKNARVLLKRSGDTAVREETPPWPENTSRSSGTVSFPLTFEPPCTGQGGTWTITVEAVDERGHSSNVLSGQIILATAG